MAEIPAARRREALARLWTPKAMLVLTVQTRGRRLVIQIGPLDAISPCDWVAIALVASSKIRGVEEVFDDHEHSNLGLYKTLEAAMCAGETYALEWSDCMASENEPRSKAPLSDACPCEEISPAARGPRRTERSRPPRE